MGASFLTLRDESRSSCASQGRGKRQLAVRPAAAVYLSHRLPAHQAPAVTASGAAASPSARPARSPVSRLSRRAGRTWLRNR